MRLINNKIIFFSLAATILLLVVFLRFFKLNASPPSLYWEEVALGYDAYSVLKTARDHHGNFLPTVAFESFGDFKPSFYFYAAVPFVKIFGLNSFSVRLPTVFASIAIIFGIAVLAKNLFKHFYLKKDQKEADFVFYLALFLASISPWLLTFSRSAWESTLATALIIWGVSFWLRFLFENKTRWAVSAVSFLTLSTYAYHGARITAPLIGLYLFSTYLIGCFFNSKKIKLNVKAIITSSILAILLFLPVGKSLFEKTGQQRINETSIFNDISIIEQSNKLKNTHDNSLISKVIYHRYVIFSGEVTKNFLNHFDFKYLFVSGDINPRHSIQTFGEFYYLDLIFFVFAVIFLFNKRNKITFFLLFYLFVSILPAAFTKTTPHALRTLAALPVFIVFITFGIWQFLQMFKSLEKKNIALFTTVTIYLLFLISFFYQLIYIYPNQYKREWQFGYEEMVKKIIPIKDNYEKIYITREQGRPAMYYFFYAKVDPRLTQSFNKEAKKDQGEFLNFENIEFIDKTEQIVVNGKTLVVSSMDFYKKIFEDKNSYVINKTIDQTWILYEIN